MKNPNINIAVFGHAKHGKSTFAGRVLAEFGSIDEKMLKRLSAEAIIKGKDYNAYNLAFLERRPATYSKTSNTLDNQSRTVVPEKGSVNLSNGREVTIIDTPGYSRFLNNIIYSAHLADLAILAIEAGKGIEASTTTIMNILKSFDIPIIAIVITKMDNIDYSKSEYLKLYSKIISLLSTIYDNNKYPPVIPVCSLTGEGFSNFNHLTWSKKSILDIIKNIKNSYQSDLGDLKIVLEGNNNIYNVNGIGTVLVGTLESGILTNKTKLVIEPQNTIDRMNREYTVKSIKYANTITSNKSKMEVSSISARSIVSIAIQDLNVKDAKKFFRRGGILGIKNSKPKVANMINTDIIFFEPDRLYAGKEFVIYTNASHSTAIIGELPKGVKKIKYQRKNKTRDVLDAIAVDEKIKYSTKLKMKYPICIEAKNGSNRLTKFLLKQENRIVACGICKEIIS